MELHLRTENGFKHAFQDRRGRLYPLLQASGRTLTEQGTGWRGVMTFPCHPGAALPFPGACLPGRDFQKPIAGVILSRAPDGSASFLGPMLLTGLGKMGGVGGNAVAEVHFADVDSVSREVFIPLWHQHLDTDELRLQIGNHESRIALARSEAPEAVSGCLIAYAEWLEERNAPDIALRLRQEAESLKLLLDAFPAADTQLQTPPDQISNES